MRCNTYIVTEMVSHPSVEALFVLIDALLKLKKSSTVVNLCWFRCSYPGHHEDMISVVVKLKYSPQSVGKNVCVRSDEIM